MDVVILRQELTIICCIWSYHIRQLVSFYLYTTTDWNSANVHCTWITYKMCYNVRANSTQSVCSAPYGLISFSLISKRLWETWNLKWGFSYNVTIRLKFMEKRAEISRYESITYMCNINGIIQHIIQLVNMIFESVPTLEVHKKWHIVVVMEDCYFP